MGLDFPLHQGKVFYGLHFSDGIASSDGGDVCFVSTKTCKEMDKTFGGKPVFVGHPTENVSQNMFDTADGYVTDSFFNQFDGKHWAKFILTKKEAIDKVSSGDWGLSNAYFVSARGAGGIHQGIEYNYEVTEGVYEHLAIVPLHESRYNSKILTEEEFNKENKNQNNIGEKKKMPLSFKIFNNKKQEVTNVDDMTVKLPRSDKEVDISKLVNDADEQELKNLAGKQLIKVNNTEMSVKEAANKYKNMIEEKEKNDDEEKKKENMDEKIKINDTEMSLKEAANKYKNMMEEKAKNDDEEKKKENTDEKVKVNGSEMSLKEAANKYKNMMEEKEKNKNKNSLTDSKSNYLGEYEQEFEYLSDSMKQNIGAARYSIKH